MTDCTYCHRLTLPPEQRATLPWPSEDKRCDKHQRVFDEIDEAKALEAA